MMAAAHMPAADTSTGPVCRARAFLLLVKGLKHRGSHVEPGTGEAQDPRKASAKARNCPRILFHVTTGGANMRASDRLLRAAGLKCVGGGYVG